MLLYYYVGTGVCPKGTEGSCHHPPPWNLNNKNKTLVIILTF